MIRLCAFADEADASLDGQIAALRRGGIEYIELRGINGMNISTISEEDAARYKAELDLAGIKVWSIGGEIGVLVSAHADASISFTGIFRSFVDYGIRWGWWE